MQVWVEAINELREIEGYGIVMIIALAACAISGARHGSDLLSAHFS
jgi:hypothetical protein